MDGREGEGFCCLVVQVRALDSEVKPEKLLCDVFSHDSRCLFYFFFNFILFLNFTILY